MEFREGMKEKYEAGKAKNSDPYGNRCFTYAAEWADLMEAEIAKGKTVAQCAKACADKADYDGITGFMYGVAVSILSDCWKNGEELRRWHNLDTQISNEGEEANKKGGVLNPALINISPKPKR